MITRFLAVAGLLALSAGCAQNEGIEVSELTLSNAPPDAPMRAGYLTLTNNGKAARTLSSARSDAYGSVEFHQTETVDGQARMREEKTLVVAAGETVVFEPYGRHLMLMMPTPAAATTPISIDLCFDDGECVTASTAP